MARAGKEKEPEETVETRLARLEKTVVILAGIVQALEVAVMEPVAPENLKV